MLILTLAVFVPTHSIRHDSPIYSVVTYRRPSLDDQAVALQPMPCVLCESFDPSAPLALDQSSSRRRRRQELQARSGSTLRKFECFKQAWALNTLAWNNEIEPRFYFVGFWDGCLAWPRSRAACGRPRTGEAEASGIRGPSCMGNRQAVYQIHRVPEQGRNKTKTCCCCCCCRNVAILHTND